MFKKKLILIFLCMFLISLTSAGSFGYNYLEHPNSFFGEVEFDGGWLDGGCSIIDGEIHCQKGFFYNLTSVDVTKQNMTILENLEIDGNITANWFNGLWNGSSDYLLTSNWNATNTSYSPHEDGTAAGQMAFWNGTKWVKTETSELFWDDTNKRLGIGTNEPALKFEVKTDVINDGIRVRDSTRILGELIKDSIFDNGILRLYDGGSINVKIDSSGNSYFNGGNVGIGTISPDTKLQVVGDFSLQDDADKIFLGASQDVSQTMDGISFNITDEVGSIKMFFKGFLKYIFDSDVEITGDLDVIGTSQLGDGGTANYLNIADDGELTLNGTARVSRHLSVGSASWKNGASAPTEGYDGAFVYLAFDDTSDDEVYHTVIIPYRWDSSEDVEFAVDWYYTGVQDNGNVTWDLEYKSIKAGEVVTGGSTTISQTSAGTHTTGQMVRTTFTTKILASNLEAHDTLALKLYRDVSEDGMTSDARLLNTHFHFIENKLGKAT